MKTIVSLAFALHACSTLSIMVKLSATSMSSVKMSVNNAYKLLTLSFNDYTVCSIVIVKELNLVYTFIIPVAHQPTHKAVLVELDTFASNFESIESTTITSS